jgi:hypothetical protein
MITLIGCGFVGGLTVNELCRQFLARHAHLPEFSLIDDDRVEERNLPTQEFYQSDLWRPKAEVLASQLESRYGAKAKALVQRIERLEHIPKADVILDCVDNIATRQLIHRFGLLHDTVICHIALSPDGVGFIDWTTPSRTSFRFDPWKKYEEQPMILPPCELIKWREQGLRVAVKAAEALYHGHFHSQVVAPDHGRVL